MNRTFARRAPTSMLDGVDAWTISGLVLLTAAALASVHALFADRPRGRRRCRRCWYDMKGTPGLTCPECGRVHRGERDLLRTRRRWRIAGVGLLLAVLGAGLLLRGLADSDAWHAYVPSSLLVFRAGDGSWVDEELERRLTHRLGGVTAPAPERLWAWQRAQAMRSWRARGSGAASYAVRSPDYEMLLDPDDWPPRVRSGDASGALAVAVGRRCPDPGAWREMAARGVGALNPLYEELDVPPPGEEGGPAAVSIAPLRTGGVLEAGCVLLIEHHECDRVIAMARQGDGWAVTAAAEFPRGWHDGPTTLVSLAGRAFVASEVCFVWGTGSYGDDVVLRSPDRADVPVVATLWHSHSLDMFASQPSSEMASTLTPLPGDPDGFRAVYRMSWLGDLPAEGERAPIRLDPDRADSPTVAPLSWQVDYRWSEARHGFEVVGWDWTGEDPPRCKPAHPPMGSSYEGEDGIREFNRAWRSGVR